jgi:hypothetical protein
MQARAESMGTRGATASRIGLAVLAVTICSTGCGWILGLDQFVDAPPDAGGSEVDGGTDTGSCEEGELDCAADTPRVCLGGTRVPQAPCTGSTPSCFQGECVVCSDGDRRCAGATPRRCDGGAWVEEAPCVDPFPGCRDGQCVPAS